jgi:S1-C subfamily serine protease/regulation of enolase protein 1 (concanavalin A-like superfamily)
MSMTFHDDVRPGLWNAGRSRGNVFMSPPAADLSAGGPAGDTIMVRDAATMLILTSLVVATARGQESIPLRTVAEIKDATVYIVTAVEGDEDGPKQTGSGFLIKADGRVGYIVTNAHVITPEKGEFRTRPSTHVVFRSGTKAERRAKAEVVASDAGHDLAILRVENVPDLPAPIGIAKEVDLAETMPVYVFGFPFGEALAFGQKSPSVVVGRGGVSSIRRDEDDRPRKVLIDGALNPGNSGGPVVDVKGRLVGVAVATIRGAHIGIAIAPPELQDLLAGRPEAVRLKVRGVEGGNAQLGLEVALVDPLDRLKSVTLLYALGDAKAPTTTAGDATAYGPLPGAKSVSLAVKDRRGVGTLSVPAPSGKDVVVTYQAAHVDARGKTVYAKPGRYLFSPGSAATAKALESWGDAIDPDGDCKVRPEAGGVVFDVPGKLHDLSAEIGMLNAPRILREVDGDFIAKVKVVGPLEPGAAGTRVNSVPYYGAGLVLWLDDGDYIRFERGAGYRNDKINTFATFESRRNGSFGARSNGKLAPGDAWLRLERHGRTIDASSSPDGANWTRHKPIQVDWPSKLKVGVVAVNSCLDPLTVRFEGFTVEPLGGRP